MDARSKEIMDLLELNVEDIEISEFVQFEKKFHKSVEAVRKNLDLSVSRFQSIQNLGMDAISEYDVNIASGGCPEVALWTALSLCRNHIIYYKSVFKSATKEGEQLCLF